MAEKVSRKKQRRSVPSGQMHIQATFNNTIITFTDKKGNALAAASAGACGFRGSKKGTAYAAQVATEKAAENAQALYGLKSVDVFVKGVGLGRDSAVFHTVVFVQRKQGGLNLWHEIGLRLLNNHAEKAMPFIEKLPKLWHEKAEFLVNTLVLDKENQACMQFNCAKNKKFDDFTDFLKNNSHD